MFIATSSSSSTPADLPVWLASLVTRAYVHNIYLTFNVIVNLLALVRGVYICLVACLMPPGSLKDERGTPRAASLDDHDGTQLTLYGAAQSNGSYGRLPRRATSESNVPLLEAPKSGRASGVNQINSPTPATSPAFSSCLGSPEEAPELGARWTRRRRRARERASRGSMSTLHVAVVSWNLGGAEVDKGVRRVAYRLTPSAWTSSASSPRSRTRCRCGRSAAATPRSRRTASSGTTPGPRPWAASCAAACGRSQSGRAPSAAVRRGGGADVEVDPSPAAPGAS